MNSAVHSEKNGQESLKKHCSVFPPVSYCSRLMSVDFFMHITTLAYLGFIMSFNAETLEGK